LRTFAGALLLFAITFATSSRAPAQSPVQPPSWSGADAAQAWTGYNRDFYTTGAKGGAIFTDKATKSGGSYFSSFWEEVEEIEVAEDAHSFYAKNYPQHDRSAYVKEIDALCQGFVNNVPAKWKGPGDKFDWSANRFNDDLSWTAITFARAYQITGKSDWLAAAEENFNLIWNRAQPHGKTDGSGGLQQTQPRGATWTPNLDSPVNFAFVIAGYLLHDSTIGTASAGYKSRADAIYKWAKANLYVYNFRPCDRHPSLVCSKIYDANNTSVGGKLGSFDYTYNYGIAIQAATRAGDVTVASTVANWLMYDSNNPNYPYVSTYAGYNILPNYSARGANNACNNCGYNGIALRGIAFGISSGSLSGTDALGWAQANVQSAWNQRGPENVTWDNWASPSSGDPYSWGDSGAVAGMLDIPAPGGYAPLTSGESHAHVESAR
jgi:hypothetical protein